MSACVDRALLSAWEVALGPRLMSSLGPAAERDTTRDVMGRPQLSMLAQTRSSSRETPYDEVSIRRDRGRCRRFVQPSSVRVRSGYGPQRRHREILRTRRAGSAPQAHVEPPIHRAREDASPPSGAGPHAPVRWECQATLTGAGS